MGPVGFQHQTQLFRRPFQRQIKSQSSIEYNCSAHQDQARVKLLGERRGLMNYPHGHLAADDDGGQQDHAAFDAGGKKFDFAVTVGVILVGGAVGELMA